eukprot:2895836-Amphidinium_carterae.2
MLHLAISDSFRGHVALGAVLVPEPSSLRAEDAHHLFDHAGPGWTTRLQFQGTASCPKRRPRPTIEYWQQQMRRNTSLLGQRQLMLINVSPTSVVLFQAVIRNIELTNPSKKAITYFVGLQGFPA